MKFHVGLARLLAGAMMFGGAAAAQNVEEYAEKVQTLAENDLQEWINDPFVVYAIREQNDLNGTMTPQQIDTLDLAWRAQTKSTEKPMIYDLLDRQASIVLRDRRERSEGVITEIILMDKYGLNVAISDATSDYYQGDEAKYLETYLLGPGAVHVGEVEFDESTQRDQTQVSMTIVDPDDPATAIGAVTFGVDLKVLSAKEN